VAPSGIEDHRGRIPSLPDDVPRPRPRRFRRRHGRRRIYVGPVLANEKFTIRARPATTPPAETCRLTKITLVVGSIVRCCGSGSGLQTGLGFDKRLTFDPPSLVIKPLEEDHTPGTVKPFQVSLVEPVACSLSQSCSRVPFPSEPDRWLNVGR
jgi:hypothetical protein